MDHPIEHLHCTNRFVFSPSLFYQRATCKHFSIILKSYSCIVISITLIHCFQKYVNHRLFSTLVKSKNHLFSTACMPLLFLSTSSIEITIPTLIFLCNELLPNDGTHKIHFQKLQYQSISTFTENIS